MRFDPLAISGSLATDASASEPLPANDNSFRVFLGGRIDQVSDTFGDILAHTYDTAGRLTATATTVAGAPAALTTTYTLDANGNRTELLWPDGYYVGYCFDSMNRMTAAMANSTSSGCATNVLATYTYDPYSRRTNLAYGASASMGYAYTPANDLTSLTLNMTGTGNDNAWTLGYSNAHQLASEAASIANYKWEPACATSPCTDSYATVNTLNQYPSMTPSGGTAQTQSHDGNGNLTGDGTLTYTYDPENRLMTACNNSTCTGTMSAAYAYDPLGRCEEKSGTGVTAAVFLQDGDDEIAEYNTSGVVQRRFVPGPTVDDAIAMVPASGTTELFYTDHHGSVVATSDSSGNLIEGSFVYDSYGNCYLGTAQATSCTQPTGSEPFKFTGQYYDAETGCYYYRARMYCADILHGGRFLQTDPVGYKDDLNLYTYVGNDPTDRTDPMGETAAMALGALTTTGEVDAGEEVVGGGPLDPVADAAVVVTSIVGLGVAGYEFFQPAPTPAGPTVSESRGPKTQPVAGAAGPHSVPRPAPGDGPTRGYTTYGPNPQNPTGFDDRKRTDVTGKPHTNPDGTVVPTPHVHKPGQPVRPAKPFEVPKPPPPPPPKPTP